MLELFKVLEKERYIEEDQEEKENDIEMKKGVGIMEDLEEKLIMQKEMEKELKQEKTVMEMDQKRKIVMVKDLEQGGAGGEG